MSCANTPRVTHCFRRPLRGGGAGVCAAAAVNATAGRKSRRRIGSLPDQEVNLFRGAACQAAEPRVVSAFLSDLTARPRPSTPRQAGNLDDALEASQTKRLTYFVARPVRLLSRESSRLFFLFFRSEER